MFCSNRLHNSLTQSKRNVSLENLSPPEKIVFHKILTDKWWDWLENDFVIVVVVVVQDFAFISRVVFNKCSVVSLPSLNSFEFFSCVSFVTRSNAACITLHRNKLIYLFLNLFSCLFNVSFGRFLFIMISKQSLNFINLFCLVFLLKRRIDWMEKEF